MTHPDGKAVVVLELGDGIELAEAMTILGRHFPKETGTVVHAAVAEGAERVLAVFAKGQQWPPPLQHKG
jgi:hypothetical protein